MNETLYRWTFDFHKVVRQQNSGAVEEFILPYSAVDLRIQKWKNYWNRSTFAKVIVKIKVARFLWPTLYIHLYFAKRQQKNNKSQKNKINRWLLYGTKKWLVSISLTVIVLVITGTCLHKELVADARVVDVVNGCREDDRKCLEVRHDVLRHGQRPHAGVRCSKKRGVQLVAKIESTNN